MELQIYPAKALLEECPPANLLPQFTDIRAAVVKEMRAIMHQHNGVGLAAPQVGVLTRIFIWNTTGNPSDDQAIVNPELVELSGEEWQDEGCLSLPKVAVSVKRATSSKLVGYTVDGHQIHYAGNRALTRIWQHELDHLNGVLMIDDMSRNDTIANKKQLRKLLKNAIG